MKNNVDIIVEKMLCCGCGLCVYICPKNAITMIETPGGLLIPEIDEKSCNNCGLCSGVCPGDHLNSQTPPPPHVDPFKGEVIAAYCGKSTDPQLLLNGQSGGIATTLLLHLLDTDAIEKAMVTEMPSDGSLRPTCHLTNDRLKVIMAQGSKYCSVPLNSFLPKPTEWKNISFALVGLPCHFHGLSNIMSVRNDLQRPLTIGLVCDRVMSRAAIDYLVEKSRLPKHSALTIKYRDKKFGGWPGNVSVKSKNNQIISIESQHRMWCKGIFTPLRCYLCFDKMNFSADIVLGDAWGFEKEEEGLSVIIARTTRGYDIIEKARKAGVINAENVDSERIFNGQHIESKRKDWTAITSVWQNSKESTPNFGFSSKWHGDISGFDLVACSKKLNTAVKLTTATSRKRLVLYAKNRIFLSRVKRKALNLLNLIKYKNNELP